jgi:hypothetical protein
MSETLRFQTNVPEFVALQFAEGLPVSSKFSGDQVMYTLTDDRRMYLPPIVADKIRAAGITAGECFSICKREVKSGNRRTVEYQIETAASGNAAASSTSPLERTVQSTIAAPETPVSTQSSYPVASAEARRLRSDGNAARSLHAVPAPAAAPAADSSAVALMKIAGCGAIDAVLDVERYAQERGMTDFAFGADNIQKIASCLFIELCKKAGRG